MTLKLSKANEERPAAERHVDAYFAAKIQDVFGPLALVHAAKLSQALAGHGPLIDDEADRDAIIARANEQHNALAALDRRRRDTKAAIRAANTSAEIAKILEQMSEQP